MSLCLTDKEIQSLTRRRQRRAQMEQRIEELNATVERREARIRALESHADVLLRFLEHKPGGNDES